jgi:hypothetical protein
MFVLPLLVAALLLSAAKAADVACIADALASSTATTTAHGGDGILFMSSASDVLLLAFPSEPVAEATLVIPRLGCTDGDSYDVTVTALVDSWDETTATYADTGYGAWTHAGVIDSSAPTATASVVCSGTDAVVSVDVAAVVADTTRWLPQRGLAVQIATTGEPFWTVYTRESSGGVYTPYLADTYTTTPWVSDAPTTTTTTTTSTAELPSYSVVFSTNADAIVHSTTPTTNYGTDQIGTLTGTGDVYLVGFPVALYAYGAPVVAHFSVKSMSCTAGTRSFSIAPVSSTWAEQSATYDTTDGSTAWADPLVYNSTYGVTRAVTCSGTRQTHTFDITDIAAGVFNNISGMSYLAGFSIRPSTDSGNAFTVDTRESSSHFGGAFVTLYYNVETTVWSWTTTPPATTSVVSTSSTLPPQPIPRKDITMTDAVTMVGVTTCVIVVGMLLYVIVLRHRPITRVNIQRTHKRQHDTDEDW